MARERERERERGARGSTARTRREKIGGEDNARESWRRGQGDGEILGRRGRGEGFWKKKTGEMRPKMVVSCVGIGKNEKKN